MARLTKAQREAQEAEAEEARAKLRDMYPPGSRVHVVSANGVCVVLYPMRPTEPYHHGREWIEDVTWLVRKAVPGWEWSKRQGTLSGIDLKGSPTTPAFHLVYTLGRALYPKGFIIPESSYGRNELSPGDRDPDGGYALKEVRF